MKFLLLASFAWLVSSFAPADELKRERLPADVDFVVHFDMEGFKQTQLWKSLSDGPQGAELREGLEDMHEFKEHFGIDPFTEVRAVTLFKTKTEEEPTVVLFSTSPEIDGALTRFQKEAGYQRITESGIELHTWSEGDGDTVFAYVHTAASQERVVVLAGNRASALRAARVLRNEEPSHARDGSLLRVAPAPGSFLYLASAEIPHVAEFTPASQVFGLAQGIQVDLGEAGGFLRGHMGVTTGSPEDALNISNVANGLISLARLASDEVGEAMELLTGLRLNTRGSEVTVDFEFGIERLMEILRSLEDSGDDVGDDDGDADEGRSEVRIHHRIK